ncbi:uncharacterized protein LOC116132334 [Pistacia vera]|uniref:uncharacterized protein LOC116132334 n=1 Tax=Pistacia vera TaxID=55513 RepID=UPI0012633347|nr:uncharacterized protein LOC116132334 [Pistacia vera]
MANVPLLGLFNEGLASFVVDQARQACEPSQSRINRGVLEVRFVIGRKFLKNPYGYNARYNYYYTGRTDVATTVLLALSGKFDMMKMRELIAHWVLMHEHPFMVVEEEGLSNMMKYEILEWTPVSRHTCKKDCMKVYESEKVKLKTLLKSVTKISLTTNLWNLGN